MSRSELKREIIEKFEKFGVKCKYIPWKEEIAEVECEIKGFDEVIIFHGLQDNLEERGMRVILWDGSKIGHSSFFSSPFESPDQFAFKCSEDKKCRFSFEGAQSVVEQDTDKLMTKIWHIPHSDEMLKVNVKMWEDKETDHLDIRFEQR